MKLLPLYALIIFSLTSCFPKDDECDIYRNNIELSFIEITDASGNNLIANGTYGYPDLTLTNGDVLVGRVFPDDFSFRNLLTIIEDGLDLRDNTYELNLSSNKSLKLNLVFSTYISKCNTKLYAVEDATWDDKLLPISVVDGYQVIGLTIPSDTVATDSSNTNTF